MKRRDGKREEENVTLFFNQSGRSLDFILFFFLKHTANNFDSLWSRVAQRLLRHRAIRKKTSESRKNPKCDSKEITACFQAWSVRSVWAFYTHHQTSFPRSAQTPGLGVSQLIVITNRPPFKSHLMVCGNRDVFRDRLVSECSYYSPPHTYTACWRHIFLRLYSALLFCE